MPQWVCIRFLKIMHSAKIVLRKPVVIVERNPWRVTHFVSSIKARDCRHCGLTAELTQYKLKQYGDPDLWRFGNVQPTTNQPTVARRRRSRTGSFLEERAPRYLRWAAKLPTVAARIRRWHCWSASSTGGDAAWRPTPGRSSRPPSPSRP